MIHYSDLSRRDGAFEVANGRRDQCGVSPQRGNGGAAYRSPRMGEKYTRGTLSIIVEFDRKTDFNVHKRRYGDAARSGRKRISFDCFMNPSVRVYDVEGGMSSGTQNGRDLDVLIRVVQLAKLVEVSASPSREGFRGKDGAFHPLAGCYYSIAGGFETNPAVTGGKLEVAILRAAINSDQFPNGVIQRAPQIVNSICYYRGEMAREFFGKTHADGHEAGCQIGLDTESVWFLPDERGELPFDIGHVVVGPLDFLFGAVEHA